MSSEVLGVIAMRFYRGRSFRSLTEEEVKKSIYKLAGLEEPMKDPVVFEAEVRQAVKMDGRGPVMDRIFNQELALIEYAQTRRLEGTAVNDGI